MCHWLLERAGALSVPFFEVRVTHLPKFPPTLAITLTEDRLSEERLGIDDIPLFDADKAGVMIVGAHTRFA